MKATGHTAVMASRREPPDSLEFFPTPPWATRALVEHVLAGAPRPAAGSPQGGRRAPARTAWEPACGEGHMAAVLGEYFDEVWRSDVHDYGCNHATGSFVGSGPDVVPAPLFPRRAAGSPEAIRAAPPEWIITNPPFNLAVAFAERALAEAGEGVALLVRTQWLEGAERWERLFRDRPPSIVAPFVERVPMVKGRWDPDASTATAYAWFVWDLSLARGDSPPASRPPRAVTILQWIPPGCRTRLTRPGDRARFAQPSESGGLC